VAQQQRLEGFANQLNGVKQAAEASDSYLRQELNGSLNRMKESQEKRLSDNALQLQQHIESFARRLSEFGEANQGDAARARAELSTALKDFKDSLQKQMNDMAILQKAHLESFRHAVDQPN
jgi:ElaB/YqjD/DUF883 family membrane-anchored ribosome-binding protein